MLDIDVEPLIFRLLACLEQAREPREQCANEDNSKDRIPNVSLGWSHLFQVILTWYFLTKPVGL